MKLLISLFVTEAPRNAWFIDVTSVRIDKAYKFIQNILNGHVEDDLDFDVTFMQWVTTDISNLITQTLSADNFVSFLCEKLDSITTHSFIAKNNHNI